MIEKIITVGIVGVFSAGLGTWATQKVMIYRLDNSKKILDEVATDVSDLKLKVNTSSKDIEAIKKLGDVHDTRLKDHDEKLEHAVRREECGKNQTICSKHNDERWEEMKERLKDLKDAFNSCFDNLVSELKKGGE